MGNSSLLNLYDFSEELKLKLWTQMAIDKMVADFALLSLKNVRPHKKAWADAQKELETLGILENTLIIFTSDNGYNMGHIGRALRGAHPRQAITSFYWRKKWKKQQEEIS